MSFFRQGRRGITLLALLAVALTLTASGIVLLLPTDAKAERGPGALVRAESAYADRDFALAENLVAGVESPEADLLRAKIKRETGRLAEARELFMKVLKASPDRAEAVQGLAQVYTSLRQEEFAIAAWQKLTSLRPDDPNAWRELALAQVRTKDMTGALTSIQKALELDPGMEDLHLLMNEIAMGKHDFETPNPMGSMTHTPRAGSRSTTPNVPDPYREHFHQPDWRNR